MRKYVSPYISIAMGVFMLIAATVYSVIIVDTSKVHTMDTSMHLLLAFPALGLVIYGMVCIIWGMIMQQRLIYSVEMDGWVQRHEVG